MFLEAASSIGKETDIILIVITGICIALLAVITFFMLYFTAIYNRKRNAVPSDIEGNMLLESSWTIASVFLVLFMFYMGWGGYKKVKQEVPMDTLNVQATARQWLWSFEYENGKQSNVLNLPLDKPVKVIIRSKDVLHGFFIPAFRIKQDAVPGAEKTIWFVPDKAGSYDIFCTQYCGLGHSAMLSKVEVMSEEKFKQWLETAEVKAAAQAVQPEEALVLKGKELYKTKGCSVCHSIDGSKIVGPTWKGLYGRKTRVVTNGKEREIIADDEYIKRSELEPNADVVVGFPAIMPSQKGVLTDDEIQAIISYMKTLK